MRARFAGLVVGLAALSGCNAIFGLDSTELAPEQPPPDTDGDTVADAVDNCPTAANTNQFDVDQDGIGDVCDNCPAVANFTQADVGDGDGVGDLCDAHPVNSGDCLVLYDSFADPAQFATNWALESTIGVANVETAVGHVRMVPNPNPAQLAMFALDADGKKLAGTFDVQVRARFSRIDQPPMPAQVGAFAEATLTAGAHCWMVSPAPDPRYAPNVLLDLSGSTNARSLSSEPYGDLALVRFTSEDPDGMFHPRCRVDYGVAIGDIEQAQQPAPATTGVGVGAFGVPVQIDGVAIYHFNPASTACPAAVRR